MDLLQSGAAWLEQTRAAYATRFVRYAPAQGAPIQVRASIGKSDFQAQDGDGLITRWQSRDYLILATDLSSPGQPPLVPRPGDRIIEDAANTFEVMSPAGQPAWRWSDDYRQTYRIHTRKV